MPLFRYRLEQFFMNKKSFEIDNITWDDLSLDEIYSRLNYCNTSAGEDYLKHSLRCPYTETCEEFNEYVNLSKEISSDEAVCLGLNRYLTEIGKLRAYKFKDVILDFKNTEKQNNFKHFFVDLLILISFGLIFVYPGPGIVLFFIMIGYSVSNYFKEKNMISAKLMVFAYLIKMLKTKIPNELTIKAKDITENPCFSQKINTIRSIKSDFKPFMRGTFLISEGARTSSNPFGILFDYLRMIFHVDIIKYNSMINFIKENTDKAEKLYDVIGELDCILSIDKVIKEMKEEGKEVCEALPDSNEKSFSIKGMYHPLIKNPVDNSIDCDKNVLITGCNASGKSTFLKSITISALFAQSFGFTFAKEYHAPFYRIYSSMALKDNIDAGESYFMAEIKSLKRIIDTISDEGKVLCVIDEVLRGTNTVERIASSVEILKSLSTDNVLCLAATHDIELADLLSDCYENYHFTEEITGDDIIFSYQIKGGKATSRNAIRLLSILGYDEELVRSATKRADEFLKTSKWQ